eukprot:symbB.v1.2.004974.t1/scaffold288.1/size478366/4
MTEEPLSPTSALICHSLHNYNQSPPVAIVHEAHLNRRPSSKASSGMEMGLGCHTHSTRTARGGCTDSLQLYSATGRMAGDMVLRPGSSTMTGRRLSKPDGLDGYSQDLQASEGIVEGGSRAPSCAAVVTWQKVVSEVFVFSQRRRFYSERQMRFHTLGPLGRSTVKRVVLRKWNRPWNAQDSGESLRSLNRSRNCWNSRNMCCQTMRSMR